MHEIGKLYRNLYGDIAFGSVVSNMTMEELWYYEPNILYTLKVGDVYLVTQKTMQQKLVHVKDSPGRHYIDLTMIQILANEKVGWFIEREYWNAPGITWHEELSK